jgi:hypothetical protein
MGNKKIERIEFFTIGLIIGVGLMSIVSILILR